MAKKSRLVFDLKEYARFRKSPQMKKDLERRAAAVKREAERRSGGVYRMNTKEDARSMKITIGPADKKAYRDNAKNNTAIKSMEAGK